MRNIDPKLIQKMRDLGVYTMFMENCHSSANLCPPEQDEDPITRLTCCFAYDYTPQGFDYWDGIARKIGERT